MSSNITSTAELRVQQPTTTTSSVLPDASQIDAEEKRLEEQASHLSFKDRVAFKKFFQNEIANIRHALFKLKAAGGTPQEIRKELAGVLKKLRTDSMQFLQKCESYKAKQKDINDKLSSIFDDISAASFKYEPITIKAKEPFHGKSVVQHVGTLAAENICHAIGKRAGLCFELGFQTLTSSSRHTPSDWRDTVISVSAELGMTSMIAKTMSGQWAPWLVLLGIETAGRIGHAAEQNLTKLDQVPHIPIVDYNTGLSYFETMQCIPITAKLMQVPQNLLHAINNYITKTFGSSFDALGLTDENIAKAALFAADFVYKYDPNLVEERYWQKACEEIKKQNEAVVQ